MLVVTQLVRRSVFERGDFARVSLTWISNNTGTGNLDKEEEDRLSNELEDDDVKRERRQCESEYGTDNFEEQKEEEESSLLEKGKMKKKRMLILF